jgi:phosphonate transport system substrate-binding protein
MNMFCLKEKATKTLLRGILFAMALLTLSAAASAQEAFVIGVAPHTSTRVILEMYQPLRVHLEKSLQMPVEIITAPDFSEYARRALARKYDLAITTGHQARMLETDAKYIPLLTYKAEFKSIALVAAKGGIRKPADLKGKNMLGLSPTSLVTLWGEHWLADNGLKGIALQYVSASDSVAQLLISGEAAVGFMSLANFRTLKPDVQGQLRIFAESPPMAGRVYVLNSRRAAEKKRIDAALWEFSRTPEGTRYFETYKLEGYRKLRPGELKSMDRYAAEVRKELGKSDK